MIEFKNKALTIIVNILLCVWQITQWLPGLICLAIFHNCEIYRNKEASITVLKVNKGYFNGSACFSCGPVIFVTPNCNEEIIKHETGHSWQSIIFGPLFHIVVSLPSICLFLYRRAKNKSREWYYKYWPENDANRRGHVDVSKVL